MAIHSNQPRPGDARSSIDRSGVLVGDGEQAASPLDDLAAVPTSDSVYLLAVKVRGPVQ
jgi:hypothetical protein